MSEPVLAFVIIGTILIVLATILIIHNSVCSKICCICGEGDFDKLVGIDYNGSSDMPSVRIQKQKLTKSDARICKGCLAGLCHMGVQK